MTEDSAPVNAYLEEAYAEVVKVRVGNEAQAARTLHLEYDDSARRQVRATRKWITETLAVLAAIQAGLPPCYHLPRPPRGEAP